MKPIAKTVDLLDHLARNASFLVVDEITTVGFQRDDTANKQMQF
jgi:hypothetical protein